MGNGYGDIYSPIQTGAAFLSGVSRSYNKHLMMTADLEMFKHQQGRIKNEDAYRSTQRANQAQDRQYAISQQRGQFDTMRTRNAGASNAADIFKSIGKQEQEFESIYGSAKPITGFGNQATSSDFDEGSFQDWYSGWAEKTGIIPNPDDPQHKYDYRKAFTAGIEPEISSVDNKYHWSSEFKADDHPNRYVDGMDTISGKPITQIGTGQTQFTPSPNHPGGQIAVVPGKGAFQVKVTPEGGTVADMSKPVEVKQELDTATKAKPTDDKADAIIAKEKEVLTSKIKSIDTPESAIGVIKESLATLQDEFGAGVEGYGEAKAQGKKLPIPDTFNFNIADMIEEVVRTSGLSKEDLQIVQDKLDEDGYTNPTDRIKRIGWRAFRKGGIVQRGRLLLGGERFSKKQQVSGELLARKSAKQDLIDSGIISKEGVINNNRFDNAVNETLANASDSDIAEIARGALDETGDDLTPKQKREMAYVKYHIREILETEVEKATRNQVGATVPGKVIKFIGDKAVKPIYNILPETEGDPDITTMPGYRPGMRF